jgi:hypothetical protein
MKDDFDNGMGMPDEELAGETLSDVGDLGLDLEGDGGQLEQEPAGRHSGGARAKAASTPRKSSGASKVAKAPGGKAANVGVSKAKKPKSRAKKTGGRTATKAAKKKPAAKSAKKRKAGKKK